MSMVLRGVIKIFRIVSCTETIGFWDYEFGCRKRGYFRFLRLVIVSRNATNAQHVPIYHIPPKIRSVRWAVHLINLMFQLVENLRVSSFPDPIGTNHASRFQPRPTAWEALCCIGGWTALLWYNEIWHQSIVELKCTIVRFHNDCPNQPYTTQVTLYCQRNATIPHVAHQICVSIYILYA